MLLHLIRKEIKASPIAILFGVLWMLGPIAYYIQAERITVPSWVWFIAFVVATMGPWGTILLLTVGRFSLERDHGTWDFLRTLPIPLWKIAVAKWLFAIGFGFLVISISALVSWNAIGGKTPDSNEIPIVLWSIGHGCAVAFFLSILLLMDTLRWGRMYILQALVYIVGMMMGMFYIMENPAVTWASAFKFLALAMVAGFATIGFASADGAIEERVLSILPFPTPFASDTRERLRTSNGTFFWFHFRMLRPVVLIGVLTVPLIIAINFAIAWNGDEKLTALIRASMSSAHEMGSGIVILVAFLLGCFGRMVEGLADSLWRTLPIAPRTAPAIRLSSALLALLLIAIPPTINHVVLRCWGTTAPIGPALAEPAQRVAISAMLISVIHLAACWSRNLSMLTAFGLLVISGFYAEKVGMPSLPLSLTVLLLVSALTIIAAPILDRRGDSSQ